MAAPILSTVPPRDRSHCRRCYGNSEYVAAGGIDGCYAPPKQRTTRQNKRKRAPDTDERKLLDFSADDIEAKYIHTLEQQIRILELQNSFLKIQLNGKRSTSSLQESSIENRQAFIESDQYDQLKAENFDLKSEIAKMKEMNEACKRTLNEEIIQLRKELDDCQPEITVREAELARLRTTHADSKRQLAQALRTIDALRAELNEKEKYDTATLCKKHKNRQSDIENLTNHLHQLERLAAEESRKHQEDIEKLNELNKRLLELELQVKREHAIAERVTDENAWLIEENAQLQMKLSRTIMEANKDVTSAGMVASLSEMVKMQENERLLRLELVEQQKQLKQERQKNADLQEQISDLETTQFTMTETENNMCQQLEAAELASRKLGEDNKRLREEILAFERSMEEQKITIATKETVIKEMKRQLENAERQAMSLKDQIDQTKQRQRDKFNQLDNISSELKDLTRSLCDTKEA